MPAGSPSLSRFFFFFTCRTFKTEMILSTSRSESATVFCMLLIKRSNIAAVSGGGLLIGLAFYVLPGFYLPVNEAGADVIGVCIIHLHRKFMEKGLLRLQRGLKVFFHL